MPATRPLRKEVERNIAVFKALLAGARLHEVSDEFNITLRYVKETYTDVIKRLAVEAEKPNGHVFPYKGTMFHYHGEPPKTNPTRRICWESLSVPRVRKHRDYWLALLVDTDFYN